MSDRHLGSGDRPQDLAMIAADDQLLDLLAAGGTPADGDEVGAMLAAWRDDLAAEPPTLRRAALGAEVEIEEDRIRAARRRSRPIPRSTRILLGAAAAVVALAGAVTVLAGNARPDSPLWPITRILYADRANSFVAEQEAQRSIDEARQAITDAQYSDAQRLLDEATAWADQVRDPTIAQQLRDEIDALRGLLSGVLPIPLPTSSPSEAGAGTGPVPGGDTSTPTTGSDGVLPTGLLPTDTLPTLPLPTLSLPPVPLPTCIVPVPGLPLPTCLP